MERESKASKRPFNRQVLRENIKEYLIDGILRGEYRPGDRLIETRLAEELGVSQAPVREALRDLEMMGFVESVPYQGTYVRAVSAEEMRDIYTVRAALEALAGRLAAPNVDDELLERLEGLVEEIMEHARSGNAHDFARANFAFHKAVAEASHNRALLRLFDMLQFAYWTFASTFLTGFDLEHLGSRHYEVLDALRTRDPDVIARTLQQHIEELGDRLPEYSGLETRGDAALGPDLR